MIKVCHVITDYNVGGAGRWLINYLSYADYNKFKIYVVVPSESALVPILKNDNVTLIEIDNMKEKSFDGNMIHYLVQLFKANAFDVVHSHASLTARVAGKIAKVPCLINSKHCLDNQNGAGPKKWLKANLNNFLSDRIIAVGAAVENQLIQQGIYKEHVELIYNGIAPLSVSDEASIDQFRDQYYLPKDSIVVGIFARLEPVKNHKMLIDAFELLYNERKSDSTYLLIVGSGSLNDALKNYVEQLSSNKHIIFTGQVDNVEQAMNSIDINVICSVSEALSLSLIEGMMLSKACIGTKVGGIPELIDDNQTGYVVPNNDRQALKEKLKNLIDDEALRHQMGKAGYEKAIHKFGAKKMVRHIEKVYKEVLEEKDGKVK